MELLLYIGLPAVILYIWYTSIITKRNKALEALSGIDVQLKKRSDLIPNILTIAKKYMEHERGLLEEITRLRSKADENYDPNSLEAVKEHLKTAGTLSGKMSQFMIAVENYPDLKANQNMLHAQTTYNEVEEHIAASRRFYNASVNALRNAIQIFPGNIIAGLAGVTEMPFYEAEESVKQSVNAGDFL